MYATLQMSGKVANVKTIPVRTDPDSGEVTPAHKVYQFLTLDDKKGIQTIDVKDKENKVESYKTGESLTIPVRITTFKGNVYYSVV